MDFIKKDNLAVIALAEDTYKTDAEPTGANALLTRDFTANPLNAQEVQRMLDKPGMGASPSLMAGKHMSCSFKIEAAPSGVAGTPPAYADILLASQLSETVVEDEEDAPIAVDYDPVSSSFGSASLYANLDGQNFKMLGWRGAMGIEFPGGGVPYFTFNGLAVFTLPSAAAMPAADYSGFKKPELAEDDYTQEIQLNEVDFVLRNWTLTAPGNVNFRNLPGQKEVVVAGSRNLKSRLEVMMPALASFDPFALQANESLVPLNLLHGSAAGKQWQWASALTQVTGVSFGEYQGERTYILDLLHTESDTGDDDFKVTFK